MNKKMKNILSFWKNLTKRLLFIVCITIIPLNVIAITVSSLVIWESKNRVLDSYENELKIYMTNLESQMDKTNDWMKNMIAEYLTPLTVKDASNILLSYKIVDDLGTIRSLCDVSGMIYLMDKKDDKLYLKYDNNLYPYSDIKLMKEEMPEAQISDGTSGKWHITCIGGRYYYLKNYNYLNYSMGVLNDIELMLNSLLEEEHYKNAVIYMTSGNISLLMEGNGIKEITEEERKTALAGNILDLSIEWHSDTLDTNITIVLNTEHFLRMIPVVYWMLLMITIISAIGICILWKMIQNQVIRPLLTLQGCMKELENEQVYRRICEIPQTDDFKYIFDTFNHMAEDILKSHEKDIMMYQTEITNLRLQVNPHMLLNSFNMIYSLAQTKNYQCIQKYAIHLGEYFRYVLKETDSLVRLESEMNFVASYIEIQKIRFVGAFTRVYSIEDGLENALVPPLLIENFVENAMKYAIQFKNVIEIIISIRKEEDKLKISICDTGNGMDEETLAAIQTGGIYIDKMGKKHIGIWNCRRRMEVFYGKKAVLNITSAEGEGTQVFIELPYMEREERRQS